VGGGDELPLGLHGALAASAEAREPAQVLDVCEGRLDDLLAAPVAARAVLAGQQAVDALCVRSPDRRLRAPRR
jgi:hypothetical protein